MKRINVLFDTKMKVLNIYGHKFVVIIPTQSFVHDKRLLPVTSKHLFKIF